MATVNKEILQVVRRKEGFQAAAGGQPRPSFLGGRLGPVGALRKPHARRFLRKVLSVGGHPLPDLGVNGAVPTNEGEIGVGGGGDNDLDLSCVLELPERTQQVLLVHVCKIGKAGLKKALPLRGECGHLNLTLVLERAPVAVGRPYFLSQVIPELGLKERGSQHLTENRGNTHGEVGGPPRGAERPDQIEQGNVRL